MSWKKSFNFPCFAVVFAIAGLVATNHRSLLVSPKCEANSHCYCIANNRLCSLSVSWHVLLDSNAFNFRISRLLACHTLCSTQVRNVLLGCMHDSDSCKADRACHCNQAGNDEPYIDFLFDDGSVCLFFSNNSQEYLIRIVGPEAPGQPPSGKIQLMKTDQDDEVVFVKDLDRKDLLSLIQEVIIPLCNRHPKRAIEVNSFLAAALSQLSETGNVNVWGVKAINRLRKGDWLSICFSEQARER